MDPKLGGDLGALHNERFRELVLHLEELADGGVEDSESAKDQRRERAHPGRGLTGVRVDDVDQLTGGAGVRVVGEGLADRSGPIPLSGGAAGGGGLPPGALRLAPCRPAGRPASIGRVSDGSEAAAVLVMLVDDQPPVLAVMAALVEETPGFEVIGCAASGEEAVMMAGRLLPDLVVMDVNLSGIDGLEATRRILARRRATVVLLVSTYGEEAGPSLVAESGAAAYVTKAAFGPDRLEAVWSGS